MDKPLAKPASTPVKAPVNAAVGKDDEKYIPAIDLGEYFSPSTPESREKLAQKFSWRRGYEGLGEQHANDLHQTDLLPDQKEGFFVGKELPLGQVGFARGPNIWPPELAETEFRRPVMEYYDHLMRLGLKIMEVLAYLKLLRYSEHKFADARIFGSVQHTDYGGLTILLQQPGADGFELWHAATQQWIELPAIEDKFVINLGDMVQRWTGGLYKSNLHRVINKNGGERYSVG
ncbi:hypothetical protein BD289DRAFT_485745 [Coniella lustricola]|uniref:Fe2OG dioxygenase domain-containing protein n=1 Tax=Coniella lustricola TaxID=2025994 RepID=A0A2T2ZXJ6_9PEZI|nr:hypothetical protein BD289DRAFT_485745 [Coniella lustricola]